MVLTRSTSNAPLVGSCTLHEAVSNCKHVNVHQIISHPGRDALSKKISQIQIRQTGTSTTQWLYLTINILPNVSPSCRSLKQIEKCKSSVSRKTEAPLFTCMCLQVSLFNVAEMLHSNWVNTWYKLDQCYLSHTCVFNQVFLIVAVTYILAGCRCY